MSKAIIAFTLAAVLCTVPTTASAAAIVIDFESLGDLDLVTNQFIGLTFENATALSLGLSLNEFEFPPQSGSTVIVDEGGALGVTFAAPLLSVGGYFTYIDGLTLEASGTGGSLLSTVSAAFTSNTATSGDIGSAPNEFLLVSSLAGISRIRVTGGSLGNSFVLDDLTLTALSDTPPPRVPQPFTDPVLTAGASLIRAVHISELRTRIDASRARYGRGPYLYTDQTIAAGTTVVQALDITELRTALSQAYVAAGLSVPTYTDPTLDAGTPIRTIHISDLRSAVAAIEP